MILDVICYAVIHFVRVILSVWCSPSYSVFPDECLVIFTITFVSGCLQTPPVSSLQLYANYNKVFVSSSQDYQSFPLARVV